ncbi:MAG: YigZ family protein [Oscillospiraceae bacterium]|nr:YigZ family protein [Oscillospiraceae bacterium]
MEYKTIAAPCEAKFIEKKSEFIGYLCPVQTEEQAIAFIEQIRAMHRKATHNCYAYILRENNAARHSDDGEPGGTAGVPIYEVLRKEGLTDVCCVVTRYFGGIMLGAGGLVRAYTKGAKDAVDAAQIKCMAAAEELLVTVDYGLYGRLPQVFVEFDARVTEERFEDNVKISLFIREESSENLRSKLVDTCNGNVDVQSVQKINFDFAQN